jgi:hypothetical protein
MEDGPTEPFLFPEAMLHARLTDDVAASLKTPEESLFAKTSMVDMLKFNVHRFLSFNPFVFFNLLFIQQYGKSVKLLFSGLFLKNVHPDKPLKIFILDTHGGLQRVETLIERVQCLNRPDTRTFSKQQKLCNLVGLSHFEPDPANYHDTMNFLARHNLLESVNLHYIFARSLKSECEVWNYPGAPVFYIEAFTTHCYTLGFRLAKRQKGKKLKIRHQQTKTAMQDMTDINDPTRANRSGAVSVSLTGLNLALALGLLSPEQFTHVSVEFGKCSVSLWMEYDDNFAARYATIFSQYKDFHHFEIKSGDGDFSSWEKLFDLLYKIKERMAQRKRKLLQILLYKLESTSSQALNSPYKKCAKQLEIAINQLKVVLFSSDDICIHAIKLMLATYLKIKGKKFCSITLNANASNTLNMLKTNEMIFFNLNMYLKQDSVYSTNLATPLISKCIAKLSHHPKVGENNLTVPALCKQRGKEIAPHLIASWINVGQFFLTHFQLDILALHFSTLSFLAFTAIWSKYMKTSVVFHQGLEKIKPAYETIFRNFSQGGFSYSCQDYIECGNSINGKNGGGEPASTLLSFDITSSYGYAGSEIQTPTGFCNAYFENEIGVLQLAEPFARHFSFEFLSVYYTLHILTQGKKTIKTVYSNFHLAGSFVIGNYPLDLVVIFTNGDISLYQFDGAYAHGCRKGCWLGNKSFVRGRTREELEEESEKRDQAIGGWVREANTSNIFKASYTVITDCHNSKYTVKALKEYFSRFPILDNLIQNYPTAKTCSKDDVLFSSDSLTYLIVLEGFVPQQKNKPLLLKSDGSWERVNATTPSRPMLMSKNYLVWLMKKHNFQVTRIHSVFFYKKCVALNLIFKELTVLRMTPGISPSDKQLVKNVMNFSAGYFGLNERKGGKEGGKKIYKLMQGAGRVFNLHKHEATFVGTVGENNFFIKITKKAQNSCYKLSVAPLALFVFIVDFGKMRLSQILCFFDQYLLPSKYRHLYSNIDNVLLVLSTRNLQEAVDPQLMDMFLAECNDFFTPNLPGHFKQELHFSPEHEWKFVSAVIMNYVITTNDPSRHVSKSLFNNLSIKEVFDNTVNLLNKQQVAVQQWRRVNKILNKNVTCTTLNFNKTN